MKNNRINELIPIANEALLQQFDAIKQECCNEKDDDKRKKIWEKSILRQDENKNAYHINEKYDGKISAFGVTVALSGLLPALAIYFKESSEVKTRPILEVIAKIIVVDREYDQHSQLSEKIEETDSIAKGLVGHTINLSENERKELKKYVLDAAIALKQVVRTYELVKI
ncbi:hypothetical protein AGMMS49574_20270 [Bacteroidia bacterium]|nr:hypothetical protein AGMMS49574_20270 [Bacteroidia bacterium]